MLVDRSLFQEKIRAGSDQLKLDLHDTQIEKLIVYLEQLHKWNKAFNLSGIRDPERMLSHHLMDSLSVLKFFNAEHIADIGTGAGLPGIPLAICQPESCFQLVDSNSKKTRFMFQTIALLGLKNVTVSHNRVQSYSAKPLCDIVTSRAFASLADFVSTGAHLLSDKPDSRMLAMKGKVPDEELAELPDNFMLHDCVLFKVPGLDADRCIIDIRKKA